MPRTKLLLLLAVDGAIVLQACGYGHWQKLPVDQREVYLRCETKTKPVRCSKCDGLGVIQGTDYRSMCFNNCDEEACEEYAQLIDTQARKSWLLKYGCPKEMVDAR